MPRMIKRFRKYRWLWFNDERYTIKPDMHCKHWVARLLESGPREDKRRVFEMYKRVAYVDLPKEVKDRIPAEYRNCNPTAKNYPKKRRLPRGHTYEHSER